MFCSRTSNNINKRHERSLRIVLNDYSSNFNILLENNNDISNHHRNIQALLIEVFNMKNELAPPIMELILKKRFSTYNLSNFQERAKFIFKILDFYYVKSHLFVELANLATTINKFYLYVFFIIDV